MNLITYILTTLKHVVKSHDVSTADDNSKVMVMTNTVNMSTSHASGDGVHVDAVDTKRPLNAKQLVHMANPDSTWRK